MTDVIAEAARLNRIFDIGIMIAAGYQVSDDDRREYEAWFRQVVADMRRQGIAIPITPITEDPFPLPPNASANHGRHSEC